MNSTLFTPDYSHLTGLLQHLNDTELQELLDNEEKIKTLVGDLKQVQDIEAEREMVFMSNKSISEYNLSKKPIIEEHRNQLKETHEIALQLKNTLLEKKMKIESNQEATSKETLLALLQAAASESDGNAESQVEAFLQSEVTVEDFIPKYLELKKLAHLRRIKSEKFANILIQEHGRQVNLPPSKPQRTHIDYSLPPIAPVRQAPRPPAPAPQPSPFPQYRGPYPQPQPYPQYPPYGYGNVFQHPNQNPQYRYPY